MRFERGPQIWNTSIIRPLTDRQFTTNSQVYWQHPWQEDKGVTYVSLILSSKIPSYALFTSILSINVSLNAKLPTQYSIALCKWTFCPTKLRMNASQHVLCSKVNADSSPIWCDTLGARRLEIWFPWPVTSSFANNLDFTCKLCVNENPAEGKSHCIEF